MIYSVLVGVRVIKMFEIDISRIHYSVSEMHQQICELNYYRAMIEELIARMKADEHFEEVQLEIKREIEHIDEERTELYRMVESLIRIINRYQRCERKNIDEVEGARILRRVDIGRIINFKSDFVKKWKIEMQ